MQKNNVQFEDVMIFTKDFNGKTLFSIGVSGKKFVDGQKTNEYVTAYVNVQFPRDNQPISRQTIDITKSWLTAYGDRNGKGQLKLVVQEWRPHTEDSFGC